MITPPSAARGVAARQEADGGPPVRVLVVGVSTRAAAESAARAGYRVTALDAFADLDQHPLVRALSLPGDFGRRFTAPGAARLARGVECDAVAYLSSFENHPRAVRRLAAGRALWGNPPAVLERVRDPALLAAVLRRRGIPVPAVRDAATLPNEAGQAGQWLVKPRLGGGGRGVRPWRPGAPVPAGCYLQERVSGVPGSVVFVAAGGRAVPLGVSRQLVGDPAFGAAGMRYCGSILADETVRDVPRPGELIAAGGPVCTVFAAGGDAAGCYAGLVGRAARVYAALAAWERAAA